MRERYVKAHSFQEKSDFLDEGVQVTGYHQKHAIQILHSKTSLFRPKTTRRVRPQKYQRSPPVIQKVWQALDDPCAERLHPV